MILADAKECREAYREILQGYSFLPEENLYLKHFAESDLGELELIYKNCSKDVQTKGIEKEKDKSKDGNFSVKFESYG